MYKRVLKKPSYSNLRINLLIAFFTFLFLILEVRLFALQVVSHAKYEKMAEEQHWATSEITTKRGNILSKDGYTLAGTQYNYLLYAEPRRIEDKEKLASDLANIMADLKIDTKKNERSENTNISSRGDLAGYYYEKYINLLSNDLLWIGLEKNLSLLEREKIESFNFNNIGFEEEPVRYYPNGSLASNVLGFVASDEYGRKKGYFGIEGKFNEDLKGKEGRIIQELDASGIPILAGGYKKIEPVWGRDIVLTVDRTIQYIAEKKIKEGVTKYNAVSGSIIIMDPNTGEVFAMANYPTYNPSDFSVVEDEYEKDALERKLTEKRNLSIAQTYEPGSVMKPFTISTAIDLGLATPETTFEDNGPVWYSDYEIDNWDGKHYGTQNIIQLLQKSNNIGAAWVGHLVGAKKLHKYLDSFGIGSMSGIELEGEDTGILRDYTEWSDIGLANISFGQGISATPLQVLNGFNALINGGYLLEPKIVSKVIDNDGEEVELPTRVVRRVISNETSNTMINLLEQAASGGEAKYFILKNYRVGGKTGTAQIPVGGKYDPEKTNCTFVGFLPGYRNFSMIIKLEEPKTSVYAAETSVPLWMETAEELIKFFGLPPDKEISN